MREFDYIAWLRQRTPSVPGVLVGPGDDCAVWQPSQSPWLVTTDMLLEGSHFVLAEAGARRVGRKAMAVNLSDLAAMAGLPKLAVVSVGLPRHGPANLAEELYQGLRELADEFDTAIVGGDTNSWTGGLVVSVTLFGEAVPPGPILRKGARPGDWLMVTGPLGGSLQGKQFEFSPRIREARRLVERVPVQAMIDISDGLGGDLPHVCRESGVGAVVFAERIPIHPAVQARNEGRSALEHALSDGEDFELLFAVAPSDGERLLAEQPVPGITLSQVGVTTAEPGIWLEEGGQRRPWTAKGYVHEF